MVSSMVVDLNRTNPLQWEHDQKTEKGKRILSMSFISKNFLDESGGFSKKIEENTRHSQKNIRHFLEMRAFNRIGLSQGIGSDLTCAVDAGV